MRLCSIHDLPDGGTRGFEPPVSGGHPVFIVRRGALVYAYRDECPHQGARLAWRRDEYLSYDRSRIVCWAHGAQFQIETGVCLSGPCLGQRLRSVGCRVDEAGGIHLIEQPSQET